MNNSKSDLVAYDDAVNHVLNILTITMGVRLVSRLLKRNPSIFKQFKRKHEYPKRRVLKKKGFLK